MLTITQFAFHTLHIRDACSELTGAENLPIWIKVNEARVLLSQLYLAEVVGARKV